MLLLAFIIASLFTKTPLPRQSPKTPVILAILLVAISCIALLFERSAPTESRDPIVRSLIILTWGLAIAFAIPRWVNPKKVISAVILVAVVATTYLIVQVVYWRFRGTPLPSLFDNPPFLVPSSRGYIDFEPLIRHYEEFYYRPPSFFGEPQYYADYTSLALILLLLRVNSRRRLLAASFLSLGLILSTSTTGIILLGIAWISFITDQKERSRIGSVTAGASIIVGGLVMLYFLWGQTHIVATLSKLATLEQSARIGGSYRELQTLQGIEVLVGKGLGLEFVNRADAGYINSITAIILGTGLLGAFALTWYAVRSWSQLTSRVQKTLFFCYLVSSVGGSMLYSDRSFLWLGLAFSLSSSSRSIVKSMREQTTAAHPR